MAGLRGVLIPADPARPVQVVEVAARGAATIAAALGCQWIEIVRTGWLRDRRMVMVVDEEGRITGREQNGRASRCYPGPAIVGDVLVVADDGEDLASLSGFQIAAIAAELPSPTMALLAQTDGRAAR